ncbi:phospholipase A2 inhibitor and Ly6/PLAUR domain-containing protein-like isoform 2-T2 [Anomaloglossus baeobatrachus]|uniref:phospholipase A2 inhibitor and Ly6/PLAUR domain-containing protein-like isoform X2 n=1 Tax=Anomaloglossus baeobatrachus TaxID=238106 RepID=UPI003F4F9753
MAHFIPVLTILFVFIVAGNEVSKSFSRSCNSDSDLCNQDFIMNSGRGNKQVRITTECCATDDCNRCKAKKPPPYNATLNGLICPVCFKYNTYDCLYEGYIQCRGKETECMDFAAKLQYEDAPEFMFSAMGCTTAAGCSMGQKIMPGTRIVEAKRLSCRRAVPITH